MDLTRRFIESYIPSAYLERWADEHDCQATFAAWEGLDAPYRHHFNMKRGLGKDRERQDFTGTDEAFWSGHLDHRDLQNGFGRKVSDLFEDNELRWDSFDPEARDEANMELGQLLRML